MLISPHLICLCVPIALSNIMALSYLGWWSWFVYKAMGIHILPVNDEPETKRRKRDDRPTIEDAPRSHNDLTDATRDHDQRMADVEFQMRMAQPCVPNWTSDAQHDQWCDCIECTNHYRTLAIGYLTRLSNWINGPAQMLLCNTHSQSNSNCFVYLCTISQDALSRVKKHRCRMLTYVQWTVEHISSLPDGVGSQNIWLCLATLAFGQEHWSLLASRCDRSCLFEALFLAGLGVKAKWSVPWLSVIQTNHRWSGWRSWVNHI